MNVFVLGTGRCGSTTFARACAHISNYTSAHESRSGLIGESRLNYPRNHIEVDNRLSWILGRLDATYGDDAVYVHLARNDLDTARSFARRYNRPTGIIYAYRQSILMQSNEDADLMQVCLDYCVTVNANITVFLRDKSRTMRFSADDAKTDFRRFWSLVGAKGDIEAGLREWDVQYNASPERHGATGGSDVLVRAARKLRRITRSLPAYLRNA